MAIAVPRNVEFLSRAVNQKQAIIDTVGDLSGIHVMFNMVLMAIYIRPEKTKGGIIRPGENVIEDVHQGKVGLALKLGPNAFEDDDFNKFHGQKVNVGEWCAYRIGDAWQLSIKGVACRLVEDSNIKLKVDNPTDIF